MSDKSTIRMREPEKATEEDLVVFLYERLQESSAVIKAYWEKVSLPNIETSRQKLDRERFMWIWVLQNGPVECRLAMAQMIADRHHGRAELIIGDDLQIAINEAASELIRRLSLSIGAKM